MDNGLKNSILTRILSGIIYLKIDGRLYKLLPSTKDQKALADYVYRETLSNNKFQNFISKEEAQNTLIRRGLWTQKEDKQLQELEAYLEESKVALYQSIFNIKNQKSIKNRIKALKKSINKALILKHSLDYITLENYAENIRDELLIALSIVDMYNNPIYTIDNYNNKDSKILESFTSYLLNNILSNEEYRLIARTDPFRSLWIIQKEQLFGVNAIDLNYEQKNIILFSKMYDNVYESPERPSDQVIEDDDMLDGWFTIQKRNAEKEKKQREADNLLNNKGSRNKNNFDGRVESFIIAGSQEDINTISELNDINAKLTIKQRENALKSVDAPLEDKDLPDVKRDLRNEAMRQMQEKIKKG